MQIPKARYYVEGKLIEGPIDVVVDFGEKRELFLHLDETGLRQSLVTDGEVCLTREHTYDEVVTNLLEDAGFGD